MNSIYHLVRLNYDNKRKIVWQVIAKYLTKKNIINKGASVLDFGCGYCDFINSIECEKKYAYDQWMEAKDYADEGVKFFGGNINSLLTIPKNSIDIFFASNVFEHLTHEEIQETVRFLKQHILTDDAKLILLQPNFYYSYRNYFDDYTHKSIWTHISMPDFLKTLGFTSSNVIKNFLPLTVKSRFPVMPILIWAYLFSPLKFRPGQMLIVAERDE